MVESRDLNRSRLPALATRLITREYLPLGLWLVAWALLALAVGHADAVRLLAANAFVAAARSVAGMDTMQALTRWSGADGEVWRKSRRTACRIDLASLAATALLVAGLVALLWWRGVGEAAAMVALVALGVPARHPGALLVAKRTRDVSWKLGASVTGAAVAAAVLLLGGGVVAAALALAVRDWAGLLATAWFGPRRLPSEELPDRPLTFAEVAGRTEASSRRRLTYRIGKSALVVLFGPFGNVVARTGRGARLDRRAARFVPRHRGGMAMLVGSTTLGALALLLVSREPAALLGSAALARIGAVAGSALLWWNYASEPTDEDEDDD